MNKNNRLKRKANEEIDKKSSGKCHRKENQENEQQQKSQQLFDQLRETFTSILKSNASSEQSKLPTIDHIQQIISLLENHPLHHILSQIKVIPSILLLAIQKGIDIDEEQQSSSSEISLISEVLLKFAIQAVRLSNQQQVNSSSEKSPFGDDDHVLTNSEKQIIDKATNWILDVLVKFIKCQYQQNENHQNSQLLSTLQNLNTKQKSLILSPQDTLDHFLRKEYYTIIKQHINKVPKIFYTNQYDQAMLHSILSQLSSDIQSDDVTTESFSTSSIVLQCINYMKSEIKHTEERRCILHFVEYSLQRARKLAYTAFRPVVQIQAQSWLQYIKCVEKTYNQNIYISLEQQEELIWLIAKVAALDISKYWMIIDQVREQITDGNQPFGIRFWTSRNFYRAILSFTLQEIRAIDSIPTNQIGNIPRIDISHRFPVYMRPMIKGIYFLDSCMREQSKNMLHHLKISASIIEFVYNFLELESSLIISPNMHAFLLCIEEILESACWAWSVLYCNNIENEEMVLSTDDSQILGMISKISTALDTVRLPNGDAVESNETLNQYSTEVKTFLQVVLLKKRKKIERKDCIRVYGLITMVVAGSFCTNHLKSLTQLPIKLTSDEQSELRQAMEYSQTVSDEVLIEQRSKQTIKSLEISLKKSS